MDRSVPTSSKLITKRINDRNRQIHLAKLSNIKSTISREPPQSFNHMKSNKKKNQIAEDRLSEIERENKILLDKMTAIMKAGQPQVAATPVQTLERSTHKSLNVNYRKRELVKIAMENQSIMRRLQDQKPIYKRQQWEESRKQHELYLKNICEYPSTVGLPFIRPSEDSDGRPQTFQVTRGNIHALVSPKTAEKFYSPPRETNLSKSTIVRRNTEKLDPLNSSANQKTILYQTKKKIGLNNYLIHVYLNNDVFNIMASNNDRGDFKVLSIPINEGEDLVRRFGSNYKELVNRIRFKGSKIVFESNSMTFDPNDRTNSQLVTNDGIVETDDENEGDANTSNRKLNSNAGQNATHKSAPEIQEKSPKIRTVTPDEDKRVPQPVQASVKEETAQVKKEVQAKEEEPSKPKTPVVTNESKSHEEKSVTAEEKKVESKKSIQKEEGEGGSEKEEEKEKSNHSEVHESVNEKKEESVKDSKSQEQQIEESADYAESREDQEKIKESTSQAKEASEIKEQSEDENKEEPVEDAAISEEYQSKEQSN